MMVIGLSFIIYHLSYSQVVAQSVEARIDSIEILMGEQAHVTLTVTAPEGATVSFPKYERTQQLTPGVEVIETRNEGDRVQVLTLTSFDENLYYLPPFAVLVNGDTVKSKSLALKVIGIDVDTTHFEKFYGPKDVQDNPLERMGTFILALRTHVGVAGFGLLPVSAVARQQAYHYLRQGGEEAAAAPKGDEGDRTD